MNEMNGFRITLKAARVNAGLTQTEAGQALGVTKDTICNWENGKTVPGFMELDCLSRLYKIPMDYLNLPA